MPGNDTRGAATRSTTIPDWQLRYRLRIVANHGGSLTKAAAELGINRNTLKTQMKKARRTGLTPSDLPTVPFESQPLPWDEHLTFSDRSADGSVAASAPVVALPSPPDPPLADRQRIALEDTVRRLRAQIKDIHREELTAEAIKREIFRIAEAPTETPDWIIEADTIGKGAGVPILFCSDWHWGEVVRPSEVGGVNAFDSAIGRARWRLLVKRTIDLAFNHMVSPNYPGIVVMLGGDMITGEIHPELADTNDAYVFETLLDLQAQLIHGLKILADRFGRVFVPCVVGNHGRATLKPRTKGRIMTSFEWLLYCQLKSHFADDPRLVFLVPNETDAHFKVYGHRYMLTHGDTLGVKGGDGIIGALGPIMRGRIKTHGSEVQIGRDFDTMAIGHWHQYLPLPGLIVNGTLKGYDEYARLYLRAKFQLPSQSLWFSHPVWGPNFINPVYLTDRPIRVPVAANDDWISWRDVAAA